MSNARSARSNTKAGAGVADDDLPYSGASRRLRLAYLTTEYPKVSHTFIRREILELERRGFQVLRLAIRSGTVADETDRREASQTIVCLEQPRLSIAAAVAWAQATRPARWLRAVQMAEQMSRVSDRGILRHAAYVAEAATLLRICEARQISHVHVHFGTNAAAVARLMRCLGGPTYSLTIHGPDEFDAPRGFSLSEKVTDAAFAVAISDFCSAQIKRWVPAAQWHKVRVVGCTVGNDFFESAAPVPEGSRAMLSIGRLSAQKGQLLLVDAMRRVIEKHPDARLILAGDGEMRADVERRIRETGLDGHVTITGWIDESTVRERLRASRALVQPSFAEGLPVVMMEALAMRRPVIGTVIAGVPELVRHRENGWLVTAGNVDELVQAMDEAMSAAPAELDRMGAAGQERVRERHSTSTEVDKLEALFREFATDASARQTSSHPAGGPS